MEQESLLRRKGRKPIAKKKWVTPRLIIFAKEDEPGSGVVSLDTEALMIGSGLAGCVTVTLDPGTTTVVKFKFGNTCGCSITYPDDKQLYNVGRTLNLPATAACS